MYNHISVYTGLTCVESTGDFSGHRNWWLVAGRDVSGNLVWGILAAHEEFEVQWHPTFDSASNELDRIADEEVIPF